MKLVHLCAGPKITYNKLSQIFVQRKLVTSDNFDFEK